MIENVRGKKEKLEQKCARQNPEYIMEQKRDTNALTLNYSLNHNFGNSYNDKTSGQGLILGF